MEDLFSIYSVLLILLAYLIGSVPSAVWIGKLFFGVDVRKHGSKNSGATNTFRVLGKVAGFPVMFFDIFKGWAAVRLISRISPLEVGSDEFIALQLTLGIVAVFGHIFPVFAKFKGGKGIATLCGILVGVHFDAALLCMASFTVVFLVTRYVSLGSLVAALCFPFFIILIFRTESIVLEYFSMLVAIVVMVTHQKNIERLLNREENKMSISVKLRGRK